MTLSRPVVLLINGSPHPRGCTYTALEEIRLELEQHGIEGRLIQIGQSDIRGCVDCGHCHTAGQCVFQDKVNEVAAMFETAAGLIVGSPVYYASPNATLLAFMDRLFYSTHFDKTMKCGASVVSCRRAGATATFDVLNKYFTICGMPVVSSQYWNNVHGFTADDVRKDAEGLQTMRTLARNMAFLIHAIEQAASEGGLPEKEVPACFTSFPDGK